MNLVRAGDADLPEVVALMNRAYRGAKGWALEDGYLKGDRIRLDDLRAELAEKPAMQLLVWREAHALLGCVSLEPLADGVWYLGMLTVEPDTQAQQLGRRLLAAAEMRAVDAGASHIRLTVIWLRSTLIDWYQRRGYALTSETRPYPYGDDRWGVPQRDDLHFVVLEKFIA